MVFFESALETYFAVTFNISPTCVKRMNKEGVYVFFPNKQIFFSRTVLHFSLFDFCRSPNVLRFKFIRYERCVLMALVIANAVEVIVAVRYM